MIRSDDRTVDAEDRTESGIAFLEIARALALTQLLPELKERGREAARQAQLALADVQRRPAAVPVDVLARVLVDAETVSRMACSGAATEAQRHAEQRARHALAAAPPGRVSASLAGRAIEAAGVIARMRCLAASLTEPGHTAAVRRQAAALRTAIAAGAPSTGRTALPAEVVARARSAATARAAAQALGECLPELDESIRQLADQLRQADSAGACPWSDPEHSPARRRPGPAATDRRRRVRAAELAHRLLAMAEPPGPPDGATGGPADPTLLTWQRAQTHAGIYTPRFEQQMAGWLGTDPFGLRTLPAPPGFTMHPVPGQGVGNDVLAAPARHPAIRLWVECARLNYFRSQPEIFGGLTEMAARYVRQDRQPMRYVAPARSGRVHHQVLALLGIHSDQLPATRSAVRGGSELSWVPPGAGEPVAVGPDTDDGVLATLARCATFLRWQLLARDGDLYLSAIDPVIRGLPDPDAAWAALLAVLPALGTGVPAVTSVTDVRRNDDGSVTLVALPAEAEVMLARSVSVSRWLGAELSDGAESIWLLDEQVAPAVPRMVWTDQAVAASAPSR